MMDSAQGCRGKEAVESDLLLDRKAMALELRTPFGRRAIMMRGFVRLEIEPPVGEQCRFRLLRVAGRIFEQHEGRARPQHACHFAEYRVLSFGQNMLQHEASPCSIERRIGEWQMQATRLDR